MNKIKIAIVGIGNCCSSLYQGLHYYKDNNLSSGIIKKNIGGYDISDIEVVLAFDIDKRKVGKNLKNAIIEKPNCTPIIY